MKTDWQPFEFLSHGQMTEDVRKFYIFAPELCLKSFSIVRFEHSQEKNNWANWEAFLSLSKGMFQEIHEEIYWGIQYDQEMLRIKGENNVGW